MAKKIDPPKAPEKIAPSAVEISVARNGFLKPYAVCFQQLPDNIAREPLGLLAGAMTINDRSEDSAYIVNFLASLAKKEYYGNPRRGAVESFEASLHKVNVGLAELAKEGNTEWIGMLDAALCAIERNNLHFSVAGKAKVFLFRDHRLSDISDGLVEDGDDHPMKTFTDVASGKISPGDRIIITTPELFSAVSEAELERSANRLSGESFDQFLRTAAVNRLDVCAAVSITVGTVAEYARPAVTKPKRTLATLDSVPNAWSRAIFETSKQHGNSVEDSLKEKKLLESDRVDDKTGHIYVTGETVGEEPSETWERARIFLADAGRSFRNTLKASASRTFFGVVSGARFFGALLQQITRSASASIRSWHNERMLRKTFENHRETPSKEASLREPTPSDSQKTNAFLVKEEATLLQETDPSTGRLAAISKKTIRIFRSLPRFPFPQKNTVHVPVQGEPKTRRFSLVEPAKRTLLAFALIGKESIRFVRMRSQKQRLSILILFAFSIGAAFFFLRENSSVPKEEPMQPILQESPPLALFFSNDHNVHVLGDIPTIMNLPDVVSIVHLKDTMFFVTRDAIYSAGKDGGNAIQVAYPDGAIATRATAMSDLNAILVLSESGKLYFFTPATNRFAEESTVLPDTTSVADIAAASTYLYVLNANVSGSGGETLLRYPRAEGGFGTGIRWFKEAVSVEPDTRLAVSDSVFIASQQDGIRSFFRGTRKDISFESSATPVSFTDLSAEIESASLFVLDGVAGRIVEYDTASGAILNQYASDSLKGATHFTVDPTTRTASVAAHNAILMAEIPTH